MLHNTLIEWLSDRQLSGDLSVDFPAGHLLMCQLVPRRVRGGWEEAAPPLIEVESKANGWSARVGRRPLIP